MELTSLAFVDRLSSSARGFGDGFRSATLPNDVYLARASATSATDASSASPQTGSRLKSPSPAPTRPTEFDWLARDIKRDTRALNSAIDRGDPLAYIRAAHAAVAPNLPEGVAPVGEFVTALTQLCQKRGWPNPAFKIGTTLKSNLKYAMRSLSVCVCVCVCVCVRARADACARVAAHRGKCCMKAIVITSVAARVITQIRCCPSHPDCHSANIRSSC
jgi:hypothetical protein